MKIKSHVESNLSCSLSFALYMWTFQKNRTPYGEFDAISHWELSDYIAETDKTFMNLPPFIDYSYGGKFIQSIHYSTLLLFTQTLQ